MPLISDVQYSEVLTQISIQFQPAMGGYLADAVMPPVPVVKEQAVYWKYDNSRFDVPDSLRAPRTSYNRIDWKATRDSYACEEYGLEGEIDDRERDNASAPLDLEIDTTEIVTDNVLNNREKRIVDLVMSTTNVTQNQTLSGTSQWSDITSGVSDPISVAKTARTTIYEASGYRPNKVVIPYLVFEVLKMHPLILERIQFGSPGQPAIVTKQLLANLFEVEEVLVGGVLRRTSADNGTDVIADVWGKDVLFFYSEPRPSLKRASFGYQMRNKDLRVFRYREDKIASDIIRVTEIQAEKIVAAQLAYLVKAATA